MAGFDKAKEHDLQGATTEDAENALPLMFNDGERELKDMTDLFPKIKSWEKSVMEQFRVLEQELDNDIFKDPKIKSPVHRKLDHIKVDIVKLKSLISGVDIKDKRSSEPKDMATEDDHHMDSLQDWAALQIEDKIFESGAMSSLIASFHCLESSQVKMCSLCLSIFPENSVIKKKTLIYWWIGEGLVTKTRDKTAEEVGEQVFQDILNEGYIRPRSYENKRPSMNSFAVYPWIRLMLIRLAKVNKVVTSSPNWTPLNERQLAFLWQGRDESYNKSDKELEPLLTVFNLNVRYLRMAPELLTKLKNVRVLQMGCWQNSVIHHIEVENKMLFNGLGSQKHLKYLSLRGISRIEILPDSISKLSGLEILDLGACHNLEKLPPGISELKNLTHLDVSECYLVEGMPKGLDQLHNLQVLKGFVIGKAGRNSCKISDLAELKYLRKFSIRVHYQGETQKEDNQLQSLVDFPALCILKISWVFNSSPPVMSLSLPKSLTKLDLWCVPFDVVPEWLFPSRLPNLEKLYIRGGKLKSLEHNEMDKWKVKFLRLKHLRYLKINQKNMVTLFPQCTYPELERIGENRSS